MIFDKIITNLDLIPILLLDIPLHTIGGSQVFANKIAYIVLDRLLDLIAIALKQGVFREGREGNMVCREFTLPNTFPYHISSYCYYLLLFLLP